MNPIAIIGAGARFAGVASPKALFELSCANRNAIGPIPGDRWDVDAFYDEEPGTRGKMPSRVGGFVEHVDQFDPAFFGMSPREAAQVDPQQRLLLKVSYEAIEHSRLMPADLAGESVGVFIAVQRNDYGRLMPDPEAFNAYTVAGNQFSMTVSRLAYFYDLRGPTMAIDAGCSSALAALHIACQSLSSGESSFALAGGVHLNLAPHDSVAAAQAWMISGSGHCRSYDGRADGYVRGEGCGLVVLRRLADAEAAGDRVLAVIRSTAFFQEGRPGGFTSPWQPELERTLSHAVASAGVSPQSINYVEGHGVGSPIGDASEYRAIAAVVGSGSNRKTPCYLSSVKPNIGHSESASGAASIIRACSALSAGVVPPLHGFESLADDVEQDARVVIPREPQPMPAQTEPHRAAVFAFGLGGTNAAVILEAPPRSTASVLPLAQAQHLFCASAASHDSLIGLLGRYRSWLQESPDVPLAELCALTHRKPSYTHRCAVFASSTEELRQSISELIAGNPTGNGSIEVAPPQEPRVLHVFRNLDGRDGLTLRDALPQLDLRETSGFDAAASVWRTLVLSSVGVATEASLQPQAAGAAEHMADGSVAILHNGDCSPAVLCDKLKHEAELALDMQAGGALWDLHSRKEIVAPAVYPNGADWVLRVAGELWVRGEELELRALSRLPDTRLDLPTYVFEPLRCWVDDRGPGSGVAPSFKHTPTKPVSVEDLQSKDETTRITATVWLLREEIARATGQEADDIATDISIGEFGLQSVDLLEVLATFRERSGIDINPSLVMDLPPLDLIARRVVFGDETDLLTIDLHDEGQLDPTIDVREVPFAGAAMPRATLLTGATGFLGAFMLDSLLRKTDSQVYCLVRGKDAVEGETRLRKNLQQYNLSVEQLHDRVVPVIGDISQPLLGLSYDSFDLLGSRLDSIYHAAAAVNWALPYRLLKSSNVDATEEIIRLASLFKSKPIHHVSTIGVFPLGIEPYEMCFESDPLTVPEHSALLGTGYNQSKWVAEKLIHQAGSRRGMATAVYRPGFVTGRSDTGATQSSRHDFIEAFFKGCIEIGRVPQWNVSLDLMPVDYLADAIVALSLAGAVQPGHSRTYHIINPEPISYEQAFEHLRSVGYDLTPTSYPEWREHVLSVGRSDPTSAFFAFWPYYAALTDERRQALEAHMGQGIPFDDRLAKHDLAGGELNCPGLASSWLRTRSTS